jgi:hydroxymethylpyrimidine pyrophosphatase-like HAD family hydrolase
MQNITTYKGLFVTDLDGTLLTDEKTFSSKDLAALQVLRDIGYATAIATGRSEYSLYKLLDSLQMGGEENSLAVDFMIVCTGAGIIDYPGRALLKSISLGEEDVITIAEHLDLSGLDYMVHRAIPDTHHFLYRMHGLDNPDFLRRLGIYKDFASALPPGQLVPTGSATEVLCIVPGHQGREVAARLTQKFPEYSVIRATSPLDGRSSWIEIFAPAVSKSQSVAWLAEKLFVSRENTCAVGNDYNDEDLLAWAGGGYIVANGPERLKDIFPSVVSNNEGGVSEAVLRWLQER